MKKYLLPLLLCCFAFHAWNCRVGGMEDDFAWFGTLGYSDVKGMRPVHFGDDYGLLEKESPDGRCQFLNFNLEECSYVRGQVLIESMDLAKKAGEEIENAVHPRMGWLQTEPHLSRRAHLFVVAWVCWRQGRPDLAARLYEAAQHAAGPTSTYHDGVPNEKDWTFRQKMERDLGELELWRIMLAFGDSAVPRPELLEKLGHVEKNFPHCEYIGRVRHDEEILRKMIVEDDSHPELTGEQIAKLPPGKQVKEWIFRLRDQTGFQHSQPGSVDIFENAAEDHDTPAHHLLALGEAAAPQLIDALGNPEFTRAVDYRRNFFFSHEVVTIGDAALQILERISGRKFYQSPSQQPSLGSMARDGKTDMVRADVQAWREEHRKDGK